VLNFNSSPDPKESTWSKLSSGLSPEAESVVSSAPTEPYWTENLLFALYDPELDIGFWLHLGTVANDWTMWEERVLVMLPASEGSLTMWAFHRTVPERRPAASNLEFDCIEPFRRWSVRFDGYAVHTTDEEMIAGLSRPGTRRQLVIDLDIECVSPIWDAQTAAVTAGAGAMSAQGWAKDHYEQLYRAAGTVAIDGVVHDFAGTGWRDHSRGPRGGGAGEAWGGHVIMGGLFPSGRSFVFSRYWRPDGLITLEGAAVVDGANRFHYAKVEASPRLDMFHMDGERLPVLLHWEDGRLDVECRTLRSLWTPMRKKYAAAIDMEGAALNYALNFSLCCWDDEEAVVYSERSDMLNDPAPELWYAEA